jgi:hypothetical protein
MVEYATKGERSGVPADVAAETVPMVMVKQRGSKD